MRPRRAPGDAPFRLVVAWRAAAAVVALLILLAIAPSALAQARSFTFYGRGWGHGLGMSQWGARGLADNYKLSASQILSHYYSGTSIQTKPEPAEIRVGLLQEQSSISITGNGTFDLYDGSGKKRASGSSGQTWKIVPSGSNLDVFAPNATTPVFSSGVPVTARYETSSTTVQLPPSGYSYKHGRIDFDINSATGKERAIIILPFETYLYGLGEMPSSWNVEALKAQAVAGRTYALEKVTRLGQNRSVCNCGVYASTADQAYVGVSQEVTSWVDAVNSTSGQVVTNGGNPIQAYYSSSSGGFTENNENVFGGSPLSYLRGVCDPGDFDAGNNPHANWTVSFAGSDIDQRFQDAGYNIGMIQSVQFLAPVGVSGRILSVLSSDTGGVKVTGMLGTIRIAGYTLQTVLGLQSTLIDHTIYGGIRSKYDSLNCQPGVPQIEEYTWQDLTGTARGRAQDFVNGRISWNSSDGRTFWTLGGILARYDALRRSGVDLGLPTSDESSIASGRVSHFERGDIYWSSRTDAHDVVGGILAEYLSVGGPAKWGFPTTDELAAPGGRSSRFEKARIYWTPAHGAHIVYGGILTAYLNLGGGNSKLGLPVSDEYSISTGRRQDFQHGYTTWNSSTGATSYKITG